MVTAGQSPVYPPRFLEILILAVQWLWLINISVVIGRIVMEAVWSFLPIKSRHRDITSIHRPVVERLSLG